VHEIVHHAPAPKPDLFFSRVNIDVHLLGGRFQKQGKYRVPPVRQKAPVGFRNRVDEKAIPDRPSVHEKVLTLAVGPGKRRRTRPSAEADTVALSSGNFNQVGKRFLPEKLRRPFQALFGGF
jgi:hypothetical protein